MVLVILKLPLLNVPLAIDVQLVNGAATFVLARTSYCSPACPLVPLMIRVVPERLTLVIYGCGTDTETTPAINVPVVVRLLVHVRPGADGRITAPNVPLMAVET